MSNERWALLERVFADALALPAAARASFVDAQCGADLALRREIDELLRAHEQTGALDAAPPLSPSMASVNATSASLADGTVLGPWRIEAFVGRGGMGEVYRAVRADGAFEQRVALKLLRNEAVGELERFHAERRILARLEHPGIARLLDGGTAPDGRPYTVMEYVEGQTLVAYCDAQRATLAERLALFAQVCAAVAFAHRNLVIHRDIKPANILVDDAGRVKLLDFGIAKLLDAAAGKADTTMAPFTPDYAAPEQLTGAPVTTATDTYALGVLLHELLTGDRPFALRGLPSAQAIRLLLGVDPPLPSRSAYAHANAPVPARALTGDLDAIVAKCLRKEPAHRYDAVNDLARDLDRHQRHEPVLARSGARAYLARRFVRRHWLPIGVAAVFVLAVGAAALYANAARLRSEAALARADAVRDFVVDLFRQNDPGAGNSHGMSARELVDLGARRAEAGFGDDDDTRLALLAVSGALYRGIGEIERGAAVLSRRNELAKSLYPPDDVRRLDAQLDMARVETDQEHFEAGRALLDDTLARATGNDPAVLRLRVEALLASSHLEDEAGDDLRAVVRADEALALRRTLPGVAPRELAEALDQRGRALFEAGRPADAEAPLREAVALVDTGRPGDQETLLESRQLLGRVLTSLGRFDEAVPLVRANTVATRALYGDAHPMHANALHQLASLLRQSGDSRGAVPLFREALSLYEKHYGPTHSYVATALTGLGQSLMADEQPQEAMSTLLRARDLYLDSLGASHLNTLTSTIALGAVRLHAGDAAGAERDYRVALDAFATLGDGKHIYAEAARLGLGHALAAQGRHAEAIAPLRAARSRLSSEFGPDDRRVVEATLQLGTSLAQVGQRADGEALLAETEAALVASKRDTEAARGKIAATRAALGKPQPAAASSR